MKSRFTRKHEFSILWRDLQKNEILKVSNTFVKKEDITSLLEPVKYSEYSIGPLSFNQQFRYPSGQNWRKCTDNCIYSEQLYKTKFIGIKKNESLRALIHSA